MKKCLPSAVLSLACALAIVSGVSSTALAALTLGEQAANARQIAMAYGMPEKRAFSAAAGMAEAFGQEANVQALLDHVKKLINQQPDFAPAIAAASTAFVPTPEYALAVTRLAAALAPPLADAIVSAVSSVVPGVDPQALALAARQGMDVDGLGDGKGIAANKEYKAPVPVGGTDDYVSGLSGANPGVYLPAGSSGGGGSNNNNQY